MLLVCHNRNQSHQEQREVSVRHSLLFDKERTAIHCIMQNNCSLSQDVPHSYILAPHIPHLQYSRVVLLHLEPMRDYSQFLERNQEQVELIVFY